MRLIGFSTGALAYSDFNAGLMMLQELKVRAVELSALRFPEWIPLYSALDALDLSSFDYVSIHLPSSMTREEEVLVATSLANWNVRYAFPLILHPDAVHDWGLWRDFGKILCVENMDNRKPIGRTAEDLEKIFHQLPQAGLCFDIGHALQVDPTMGEAYWILKALGDRLVQVHVSEVNSHHKHDALSYSTIESFKEVSGMIPASVPLILETPVPKDKVLEEMNKAAFALAGTNFRVPLLA
jgi:hypothetical protein